MHTEWIILFARSFVVGDVRFDAQNVSIETNRKTFGDGHQRAMTTNKSAKG